MKQWKFMKLELVFYPGFSRWDTWDNDTTCGFNAGYLQFIYHKRYWR